MEGPDDQPDRSEQYAGLRFGQLVAMAEAMDATIGAADDSDLLGRFPELADVDVRDVAIPRTNGQIAGRIYRGRHTGRAGFVWAHGGAFIGGDLNMPEAHWVSLTLASRGIGVLSLDYRKALHGVRYPAPSDDVLEGWLWATAHPDELGVASDRLHLGGASAGANLVAGVTKRLRDGAGPMPSSLVLVYPLVHGELPPLSDALRERLGPEDGASPDKLTMVRDMNLQYAGSEAALAEPYAFAANGDVGRQPPVYILNSDADLLRASGDAYASALRRAGVDVTVDTEPGTHHGHLNGPDAPGAFSSIDRIVSWLGRPGS